MRESSRNPNYQKIELRLRKHIKQYERVLVAFSGGIDSSVVTAIAAQELGSNAFAVTGRSASLPAKDIEPIQSFCQRFRMSHIFVDTHELSNPDYVQNSPERCYYCKQELFQQLDQIAKKRNVPHILDGTNADDVEGHRPGKKAGDARSVRSPLLELALGKEDIRTIAKQLHLENFNAPSSPCLSSRVAYGLTITAENLNMIQTAEQVLYQLGIQECRVRYHGHTARIEVAPSAFPCIQKNSEKIVEALKKIGFVYITLDLQGFRSGSLLEILD